MKTFIHKHHRSLFYLSWLILGLVQSALTELQDDEAYYWVYGQYLDWGYFDHPPMIGVLIKLGYSIFPNELGVRLFPLLLNVLSLMIIERLIDKKNPLLFYAIALSIAVLQVSGFVAVPDIPLIFFTALFFWCYKRFVGNYSLINTVLLGLSVALLFYSKYHAVLIVLFVLLSNLKLFTRYQVYLAGIIALLLFVPHLWWQYQHDWVSFRYHLFESNVSKYKFSYTTEYVLGQLLLPGPIAGFILLPAAFLYKPTNETERALRFTLIGIYSFFLVSSFRGRVEGNWTSPVMVPLIILSQQYLADRIKWQRVLIRLLPITLVLVLAARVLMLVDLVPIKTIKERYHSWKNWPAEMKSLTHDLPIVFSSSYQRASKYSFYTGQPAYSLNHYQGRRNNYNFWPIEDSMLGKPVFFLDKYDLWRFRDSLQTPIGWVGYKYDSLFSSFGKIQVQAVPLQKKIKQGASIVLDCQFNIPAMYKQFIQSHTGLLDTTRIGIFNAKGWQEDVFTGISLDEMTRIKTKRLEIRPALNKGTYFLRFAINAGYRSPTHNSEKIEIVIE